MSQLNHPLLKNAIKVSDKVLLNWIGCVKKRPLRDNVEALMNALFPQTAYLVRNYVNNIAGASRYEDDLVSVAALSLVEFINRIHEVEFETAFHFRCLASLTQRNVMSKFLNDNLHIVRASLRTNTRRLKEGLPQEKHIAAPLEGAAFNQHSSYNTDIDLVDTLDSWEWVQESDKEELYELVMMNVGDSASDTQLDLINRIVDAVLIGQ